MALPLIGITGHKGSGKDTVGSFLVERYGYTREAFADALKESAAGALALDLDNIKQVQELLIFFEKHKTDDTASPHGWVRPYLQTYGMAHRDIYGEDYWLQHVDLMPHVVITDCRMPNEAAAIHAAGGVIWRVTRAGYASDGHASERYVRTLPAEVDILNNGTITDLQLKVALLMEALIP